MQVIYIRCLPGRLLNYASAALEALTGTPFPRADLNPVAWETAARMAWVLRPIYDGGAWRSSGRRQGSQGGRGW